jgi:hypothetical protein
MPEAGGPVVQVASLLVRRASGLVSRRAALATPPIESASGLAHLKSWHDGRARG